MKKIILKENEKSSRNEGEGACGRKIEKCSRNKGEGILGRRIWENVTSFSTHFTNRDPLRSMLTPRFFLVSAKCEIALIPIITNVLAYYLI